MPNNRAQKRRLNLVLSGLVVAALVALAFGLLTSRRPPETPPQQAVTPAPAVETPPPLLAPPIPPPAISRSELTAAADAAAAAYSVAQSPPADQAALIGRRLKIAIPIGCHGPDNAAPSGQAWWSLDLKRKTLTVTAKPINWIASPVSASLADGYDAIEGFWIPRPWMDTDDCPPDQTEQPVRGEPVASPQTLGLAQFFSAGQSRVPQRGGRPYKITRKLSDEELKGPHAFKLILEGRIAGLTDGRPIHCHANGPDTRPTCLVSVELDRVALEDTAGATLADWRT